MPKKAIAVELNDWEGGEQILKICVVGGKVLTVPVAHVLATPDLLEALEACLESFGQAHAHRRVNGNAAHPDGSIKCACDMARDARDKALGMITSQKA